jgi:hypothetical protein
VPTDEILVKARDLISFQKPSERDRGSVINWIWNSKPLIDKEQCFIKHKEDLLTLHNGREWSGFDGLVESLLLKLDCALVRVSNNWTPLHPGQTSQILTNHSVSSLPQSCVTRLPIKTFTTTPDLGLMSSLVSSSQA